MSYCLFHIAAGVQTSWYSANSKNLSFQLYNDSHIPTNSVYFITCIWNSIAYEILNHSARYGLKANHNTTHLMRCDAHAVQSVRRKRPGKWRDGDWFLHHDNAPAHASYLVLQFWSNTAPLSGSGRRTYQISHRVTNFPIPKA